MTSMVATKSKVVILEAVNMDLDRNDTSIPTALVHSWERVRFCSVTTFLSGYLGQVTINVMTEGDIAVIFTAILPAEDIDSCLTSQSRSMRMKMYSERDEVRWLKKKSCHRHASGEDKILDTSTHYYVQNFALKRMCLHGCQIQIEFTGLDIHAVRGL